MFKMILEDLDKNILINVKEQEEEQKQKAIGEILFLVIIDVFYNYFPLKNFVFIFGNNLLEILKYLHSDTNIRISSSTFKPLLRPKKISMGGRVFFNNNISNNDNNNNSIKEDKN